MFNVGDKVVYPMHGAGVIESIEEKEVLGELRKYYVMRLPLGDMRVMVPMASVQQVGLRQVIDEKGVEKVFSILREKKVTMNSNWNKRYRTNLEKIKSGNVFEVAEVVRNLILRDQEKGLSTGERRMLENARQILVSEIVLAQEIEEDKVESLLEGVFG